MAVGAIEAAPVATEVVVVPVTIGVVVGAIEAEVAADSPCFLFPSSRAINNECQ